MKPSNMLSAVEAARRIANRELTSEQLVRDCLDRIGEREATLHAWAYLDREAAIAQARTIDAGANRGLLRGLPVGVKDLIDTADMPTAYGSPIYAGHRPAGDASCVALTRAAGGIVLGKTVTTEFAVMQPGPTRNPHNPAHTPGGSSSGSAAAVADHMVPLAFGTQTAGSVIRPAAFCGIAGYKPSFGLISRVGVKMTSDTLDTVGTMGRSVPDAALFAAAVTGRHDLLVGPRQEAGPRVGLCRTFDWDQADPDLVAAMETAAGTLSAAGAKVADVRFPASFAGLAAAQVVIMQVEHAQSFAYERLAHWTQLSARLRESLENGLKISIERYDAAQAVARACREALAELFSGCDVLLAPSARGAAPAGLEKTGDPVFNRIWTLLGTPCVTIPVAKAANGLPVGLQVVGLPMQDSRTLAHAHWMHETLTAQAHS